LIARHLTSLGLALLLTATAYAQRGIVGPGGGGAMYNVTINPNDPREVLLSCDMTGAYISHDGGHHWRMFNLRGGIRSFAFDPVRRGTLYALTDALWQSTDDGATWHMLWPHPSSIRAIQMDSDHAEETFVTAPNPIGTLTSLAIDPAISNTLYATVTRNNQASIVQSNDQGHSWNVLRPLEHAPLNLWVDPRSPRGQRDLYVATSFGIETRIQGIWKQTPDPSHLDGLALGFPSQGSPIAYAVVHGDPSRLVYSRDGGQHWQTARLPGKDTAIRAVATSLHHPETAYVSFRNMAPEDDHSGRPVQGIAKTIDAGEHWQVIWKATARKESANIQDAWIAGEMTPGWAEEPLSLTVDGRNPDLVYATDLGRTLGSTDGGKTWKARYSEPGGSTPNSWQSTGLDVTTTYGYEIDPHDPRRRFILTTDIGLFRSEDSGRSWIRSAKGVPDRWENTAYSIAFDPKIPGKMWSAWSYVHDLPRPKMWRNRSTNDYLGGICVSTDGGRTWQASSTGMPPTAPTHILIDPASPAGYRTLWAATVGHGVYRSSDDGRTWSPINKGITQPDALAWRLTLSPDGSLYALIARRSEDGGIGNSGDGALYRSTDRGDHWSRLTLPAEANAPNGLAVDPRDPKRLYLALWARSTSKAVPHPAKAIPGHPEILNGEGGGIALSTDGGHTWHWVLDRDRHVYDVTIDPRNPNTLYAAGFESTAWISRDRGEHWRRIPGYNFKWGHRVQSDPEDPSKVYISTFGGGLWHLPIDGKAAKDISTPALLP
jgi:photosystem II stability/assembly factor-like uncharacterized protein